jgi:hypothetical protein
MSTASTTTTAISSAAIVREALGQAAQYQRLEDGRHRVQLYDRAAGRLLVGEGRTVAEAVRQIKEGRA